VTRTASRLDAARRPAWSTPGILSLRAGVCRSRRVTGRVRPSMSKRTR